MSVSAASPQDSAILEKALLRLETLTFALEKVADEAAREMARELLELVLDLHALALARITAIVAGSENGGALVERLTANPHIRAILLLHGLHPQDPEQRLRQAIEARRYSWAERGIRVDLTTVQQSSARVVVSLLGASESVDLLRNEIECALVDAAPDLDEVLVEIECVAPTRTTVMAS